VGSDIPEVDVGGSHPVADLDLSEPKPVDTGHAPDRIQTGGSTRPRSSDPDRQYSWADERYEEIRVDSTDVHKIAETVKDIPSSPAGTPFSEVDIADIKEHLFNSEHPLTNDDGDGTYQARYDADPDEAEAWTRLADGCPVDTDIIMLQHEYTEMNYYRDHPGASYDEAHAAANQVADWWTAVKNSRS
jgi:hypothetical protein